MAIYISELKGSPGAANNDKKFVEIIAPYGEDLSGYVVAVYDDEGYLNQTLGLGSHVTTWDNQTAGYVVGEENGFPTGFTDGWSVALVDDTGNVLQFLGVGTAPTAINGPAAGTSPRLLGDVKANRSYTTNDGGENYTSVMHTKGTIPCYASGTMIDTPVGPRAVESLCPGDVVLTLDNGPQKILWTRCGDHPLDEATEDARPVFIRAGALGRGLPERDLIVSPQHRILVGGRGQVEMPFVREAFVAAKALTPLPGIRVMKGRKAITWVHFACARHEVVRANGCWSESLLLGPMMLASLRRDTRKTLLRLFPLAPEAGPKMALNGPAARPCVSVREARTAIARCRRRSPEGANQEIADHTGVEPAVIAGLSSRVTWQGLANAPS
jgi:hypothetical protein